MGELKLFNLPYFIYLFIFIFVILFSLFLLQGKSEAFKKRYIASLLFFSLLIHFMKLLFPPYVNDTYAFRKITPENICALSTLAFPFIFLSKNKVLKDYMFYIGVISGSIAVILPLEAINKSAFVFDVIRFYICHIIITVAPFLMVATGLHELDYHRIYKVPIVFLIVMAIIMINEIILIEVGLIDIKDTPEGKGLLEIGRYRNFSLIFGPTIEYLRDNNIYFIENFIDIFVPEFFRTIPFGEYAGEKKYWPILWAVVPVFIFLPLLSGILAWYWEKDHMKEDLYTLKNNIIRFFKME
ncbi:MAG TPA: YwaF family protein [Acholeplasmataceae bacterium]|jgi:hypothetical protein|nr:YwaF family protein [Acholeplasmataceae bacterium]